MQKAAAASGKKNSLTARDLARALRLPFISASAFPFILGSLIHKGAFNFPAFFLGLACAVSTHLFSNLINDYADSRSGADWLDRKFYGLFGGSKLIQEKALSEGFYLRLALLFFGISASCAFLLFWLLGDARVLYLYALAFFLGASYSVRPLALSYRYLGEPVIFILFGPALCMGGYFLQTGVFPELRSFILSIPLGLLVMNILFANEIPDYPQDKESGKYNWVRIQGQEGSWRLYLLINTAVFLMIALSVALGFLSPWAVLSFLSMPLCLKAARILRKDFRDKQRLVESAKLTIALQAIVSVALIAALFL